MLLCGELLEQVLVGGVWGLLTLGQPVTQPVLMGKEQPHFPAPALGNTCAQRWRQQTARSECHRMKGTPIHVFTTCVSHLRTHKILHTYTSFTLAESAIHLLLVLWDCRSARGCQFSLPQCQRIFGALAHFLVAQLHLADVQLISARCNTIARTKTDGRTYSASFCQWRFSGRSGNINTKGHHRTAVLQNKKSRLHL